MFLGYVHYFRALAIFFIVAGHTIDVFVWDNANIERLLRIFISNGSILFVFIAGYLFQHLSKKFNSKKYYSTKFKNVITPYLLISIPAIVVFVTIMERETVWPGFYDNSVIEQIGLFYLTGKHLSPLWFIPMISLFYLIGPLLVKADRSKFIYYTLPVTIIISCLVSRGLPYENFVHFFSVYLLGMYCSRYKELINPIISENSFLITSIILIFILAFTEFYTTEGTMSYINFIKKLMMSIFFLGLFIKFNEKLTSKYISLIADTSFGIFFIHSYVLTSGKLLNLNFFGEPQSGNLFLFIVIAIATLIFCCYLILLVKKALGRYSKFVVGS